MNKNLLRNYVCIIVYTGFVFFCNYYANTPLRRLEIDS